ncbi:hypothetical protein DWB61_00970 [Ancylomarina euxinus]|uniref:DUF4595 domain-containing protein n=1 Tax=Ancylomarina euxinus TaxID=2283627 RepID=A0A425Y7Z5_9BACT|nr:hypothetical protein [Ancylomarina euxinus]MCZ4693515.1 hypothetical protein [Ancylomarina euxinus]MUP13742.1 hypothetical protein [Ancylomarina euxinus]RRG24620.1 hypothetical protein DWB61_00970 [Ancylomarina euxinus]
MIRKSTLVFWLAALTITFTSVSCDKNDDSDTKLIETNHPVYVSEVTRDDYKNVYSYERVEDKIRLKQVDFFEDGKKKFESVLNYDDQNRLIEYKNIIVDTEAYEFVDEIFDNVVDNNVRISYVSDKITITSIDDDNTMVLTLDSDGFAYKMERNSEEESAVILITRGNNNVVTATNTYVDKTDDSIPDEVVNHLTYDTKESIDYIRMMLPCLYSKNNPVRVDEEGGDFKITYSYEYNSFNYPTKITESYIEIDEGHKYEGTSITNLEYINADEIK